LILQNGIGDGGGGGIDIGSNCVLIATNCIFRDNRGSGGGAVSM